MTGRVSRRMGGVIGTYALLWASAAAVLVGAMGATGLSIQGAEASPLSASPGRAGSMGAEAMADPDSDPGRPSVFHGSVRLEGADVPAGSTVFAWIDGNKYANTATTLDEGTSVYSIDVPADDPGTPEIEGGTNGQPVTFNVGIYAVDQRAFWRVRLLAIGLGDAAAGQAPDKGVGGQHG